MTRTAYHIVSTDDYSSKPEPLMTAAEVREWLGIGDTSLRELAKDLKLVPLPINRHRHYDPAHVRQYLEILRQSALAKLTTGEVVP
jgi:hypothetical protein